jgi:hypothetical protein
VNGSIRYILPKNQDRPVREFALRYCRVCYVLLTRYDQLKATLEVDPVEFKTSPGESAHEMFMQSVAVTDTIMGMVRRRVGSTPIAAFIVSHGDKWGAEYGEELTNISQRHGIVLFDVESAVLAAENRGDDVRTADGSHWNDLGNRLAGQALADALRGRDALEASARSNR